MMRMYLFCFDVFATRGGRIETLLVDALPEASGRIHYQWVSPGRIEGCDRHR